jgi:hypothetical protein
MPVDAVSIHATCDKCGDDLDVSIVAFDMPNAITAEQIRRAIQEEGWSMDLSRCYCDDCTEEMVLNEDE